MDEYLKLQMEGISIWKKFSSIDFGDEINKQKFSLSLFTKTSNKKNYYSLGHFNYLIDFCTNIFVPSSCLSTKKPKSTTYIEYIFSKNKLVLVKHVDNDVSLLFYIRNDFVFQLTSFYELSCIFHISDNGQMKISQSGIYVDYIKKRVDDLYQRISCDLFSYTDSIYEYSNSTFVEKETNVKLLKSYDEILKLNKDVNPYPFSKEFISRGIETLIKGGYHEK